jgi:hypothetical protein
VREEKGYSCIVRERKAEKRTVKKSLESAGGREVNAHRRRVFI